MEKLFPSHCECSLNAVIVDDRLLAPLDSAPFDGRVRGANPIGGDHQAGDSGSRHAASAPQPRVVSPRAVWVLTVLPVGFRPAPDVRVDRHPRAFGLIERQEGELGIRVVARAVRIGPGPL